MSARALKTVADTAIGITGLFALLTCYAGQALYIAATNRMRLAKEFRLNVAGSERTFSDLYKSKGFMKSGGLWCAPYSGDALEMLSQKSAAHSLLAGSRGGIKGERQFWIYLSDGNGLGNEVTLDVTGDTTAADFFALGQAMRGAANFTEARNALLTQAPVILGDKLTGIKPPGNTTDMRPACP